MDTWFKVGVVFAGIQAIAAIVSVIFTALQFFGVTSHPLPMDARFYIPSIIIGALAIFTWIALYLSYRVVSQNRVNAGRITSAFQPTEAAVAPIPTLVVPEAESPSERIFVESTPQELAALVTGYTSLQSQNIVKPYIGKWIKVTVPLREVAAFEILSFVQVIGYVPRGMFGLQVVMMFPFKIADRFSIMKPETQITAIGQIEEIQSSKLALKNCELA
jgi:hypothetical protein